MELAFSGLLLARRRGVLCVGKATKQECGQEERAVYVRGAGNGFKEASEGQNPSHSQPGLAAS